MMTRYRVLSTPQPPSREDAVSYEPHTEHHATHPKAPALQQVTYDEVIERFYARRDKGEIFNNPFSSFKDTYQTDGITSAQHTSKEDGRPLDYIVWQGGNLLNTVIGFNNPSWPKVKFDDQERAAQAARIKCISEINKTEIDSGNFAVEWSKTKALHRDLGNNLVKMVEGQRSQRDRYRKVKVLLYDERGKPILGRKGTPRYKWSVEKIAGYAVGNSRVATMANMFLGYRFGVLPLLQDLDGATKVLLDQRRARYTARSQYTLQDQVSDEMSIPNAYGILLPVRRSVTVTLSERYGILYETAGGFRTAAQLGLTRPLSTAWESLPFSFVVDWFVNVGGWLDAIQPNGAHNLLAAWESYALTTVRQATCDCSFTADTGPYNYKVNVSEVLMETRTEKLRRPWDARTPTRPALGEGFNATRSRDFAAMIVQQISRFLK